MSNNRFVLDREENVIDTANSNRAVPHYAVCDTSEKALRESLNAMWERTTELSADIHKTLAPTALVQVAPSWSFGRRDKLVR